MAEILDISTEVERPKVRLDGVEFSVLIPRDFSIKEILWLQRAQIRINEVVKQLEDDPENENLVEEYRETLTRFTDQVLANVPKKTRDKIGDVQKMQLVDWYVKEIHKNERFFASGVAVTGDNGDGPNVSPTSKGSTAARSKAGSTAPSS